MTEVIGMEAGNEAELDKLIESLLVDGNLLIKKHVTDHKGMLAAAGVLLTLAKNCYTIAAGKENVPAILREAANMEDELLEISASVH